jgi:hypothetical protein
LLNVLALTLSVSVDVIAKCFSFDALKSSLALFLALMLLIDNFILEPLTLSMVVLALLLFVVEQKAKTALMT